MLEILQALDRSLLLFVNQSLATRFTDFLMPLLTDWNQNLWGWATAGVLLLLLVWKGGRKGRILAVLVVVLVAASDQLSSAVIKPLLARPRPCHELDGHPYVEGLRMLVPCGSGWSFPSSHAANNVALASFMSHYYRRWIWLYALYAALMCYSRLAVGVHYPSDILGGGLIGGLLAAAMILFSMGLGRIFPALAVGPGGGGVP